MPNPDEPLPQEHFVKAADRTAEVGAKRVGARPRFSEELNALAARFGDQPVCLGDLLAATQGRGYNLLLVLIALPFLTPVPLPGFSIPFGLVVACLGARM